VSQPGAGGDSSRRGLGAHSSDKRVIDRERARLDVERRALLAERVPALKRIASLFKSQPTVGEAQ
jgi:hypothetical protein